jgi:hypothetical protein
VTESFATYPTETVAVAELHRHPQNYKLHPEAQLAHLEQSLRDHGLYRNIVAANDGTILAGHGVWEAAVRLGAETVEVIRLPYGPQDPRAIKLLVGDNEVARLAGVDNTMLAQHLSLLKDATDLLGTGYGEREIVRFLATYQPTVIPADADESPVSPEPTSRPGEVYRLGAHRLMCGDAFIDVEQLLDGQQPSLLLLDPPYGIQLDTDYSTMPKTTRTYRPVIGDEQPFDASPLRDLFSDVAEQFWFGAEFYAHTLGDTEHEGAWLVWDKRVDERYDAGFGSAFELCWSAVKRQRRILRHQWFLNHSEDPSESGDRHHPTQKPVALLAELIELSTSPGGIVLDLFAGSGSSLVAAELTGRRCYAMEIDPSYCDIIRARYQLVAL